jgi:hypothetical protein
MASRARPGTYERSVRDAILTEYPMPSWNRIGMSWQATSWAARQTAGSTVRKAILLLIANDANKAGVCWSGQRRIAEEAECARETVTLNLADMEAEKLIARFPRRRANGSKATDWIVLAPGWTDRGEMVNADIEEVPEFVATAAKRSCEAPSRESALREADRGGHVSLTGGPETVKETSSTPPLPPQGGRSRQMASFREDLMAAAAIALPAVVAAPDGLRAIEQAVTGGHAVSWRDVERFLAEWWPHLVVNRNESEAA